MAIQKVERWQTSNGQLFENENDAKEAEALFQIQQVVQDCTYSGSFCLEDFLDRLQNESMLKEKFLRLLK